MEQIRVQNLPDHNLKVTRENVQTSDMVFNHVKRFERNNHIGVDDSKAGGNIKIFKNKYDYGANS